MSEISNVTKQNVPLRVQRNVEFKLKFELKAPGTDSYYDLSAYVFNMRVVDSEGDVKFDFLDNRFGKATIYERELTLSKEETDSLDPDRVYYYDIKVVDADTVQVYWMSGMITPANRITP